MVDPIPLAVLSKDGLYRYFLSRTWDTTGKVIVIVGLNPSTADASIDDPTIRRCVRFAKGWGGGSLLMVNLFAYRSTAPSMLRKAADPIGPENDYWLAMAVDHAHLVVAAWGNHGSLFGRATDVRAKFPGKFHAISVTQQGMPGHPLYLRADSIPRPYP